MNKEQAISVLVTASKIGQAKGAYTLEDASVIKTAIDVLSPKDEVKEEPKVEEIKEEVLKDKKDK